MIFNNTTKNAVQFICIMKQRINKILQNTSIFEDKIVEHMIAAIVIPVPFPPCTKLSMPSSPSEFHPQHLGKESESIMHVKLLPHAIARAVLPYRLTGVLSRKFIV